MIDPILFNVSINDNQFFFIEPFTFHNFANALSAWATTVSNVTNNLESDSNIATEWFKINKMIVNPYEFQTTVESL